MSGIKPLFRIKKHLNWQFVFVWRQSMLYSDPFIYHFTFGVIKIKHLPLEAEELRRGQYKGFLIKKLVRTFIARDW